MLTTFRRQNPLLAEMLISLLFFVICACVVICIFVSAYTKSEKAVSQQEALLYAQSIAEEFKAYPHDFAGFFESCDWHADNETASVLKTFSRTEYNFSVRKTEASSRLKGFILTACQGSDECFSFRVEVLTDEYT